MSRAAEPASPRAGRRDAVDVARVGALIVVVFGHLTIAVVDRHEGSLRAANLLALRPHWAVAAALAPMPVFFAAAGYANATATFSSAVARLRSLVGVAAAAVALWSVAELVATAVGSGERLLGTGGRVATQPLWFLAAYVPFAAIGGWFGRLVQGRVVVVIGAALAALAGLDVLRFVLDAPAWIGWPGFFVAWSVPWLVGAWWRSRPDLGGRGERCVGLALAGVATVAAVALVHLAGYSPALIDVVPGARSNTTPPTVYTAVAGLAQAGMLVAFASVLDRIGRRWRRWWDRLGEASVAVYVWHLSALILAAGAIAAGFPVPARLTVAWWLTRPVWWAVVLGGASLFVLATASVRARLRRRPPRPDRPVRAAAGVVVAASAAVVVGLFGPRSAPLAALCLGLFGSGWLLLR